MATQTKTVVGRIKDACQGNLEYVASGRTMANYALPANEAFLGARRGQPQSNKDGTLHSNGESANDRSRGEMSESPASTRATSTWRRPCSRNHLIAILEVSVQHCLEEIRKKLPHYCPFNYLTSHLALCELSTGVDYTKMICFCYFPPRLFTMTRREECCE